MPTCDVIVIGASSGGIEAISQVVERLPSGLPASVFVVQHLGTASANYLSQILAQKTSLETFTATEGKTIQRGAIYVAPADHHLIIDSEQMYLSRGPRENRMRPAIDPLFRSASLAHGPKVIGVILTGSLDDGTAGLLAVKKSGGLAVVQDPTTAITADMPQSALDYVEVDHCLPPPEIGDLLGRLAGTSVDSNGERFQTNAERSLLRREVDIMHRQTGTIGTANALGELVPASCPDCGGPLWEIEDDVPRFRCHTGHAFTARHLIAGLDAAEEQSLWVALRVMEERVRLLHRLAEKDTRTGHKYAANAFAEKAKEAQEHVRRLRKLLSRE